jgi:hypothetical protein
MIEEDKKSYCLSFDFDTEKLPRFTKTKTGLMVLD